MSRKIITESITNKEFLDKLTKEQMLTRQAAEDDAVNNVLSKVPLKVYVG